MFEQCITWKTKRKSNLHIFTHVQTYGQAVRHNHRRSMGRGAAAHPQSSQNCMCQTANRSINVHTRNSIHTILSSRLIQADRRIKMSALAGVLRNCRGCQVGYSAQYSYTNRYGRAPTSVPQPLTFTVGGIQIPRHWHHDAGCDVRSTLQSSCTGAEGREFSYYSRSHGGSGAEGREFSYYSRLQHADHREFSYHSRGQHFPQWRGSRV